MDDHALLNPSTEAVGSILDKLQKLMDWGSKDEIQDQEIHESLTETW